MDSSGRLTSDERKAQRWKEGTPDDGGYFTLSYDTTSAGFLLRSTTVTNFLTAAPNQLTLEG